MRKIASFVILFVFIFLINIESSLAEPQREYGYKTKILQTSDPFLNKFYDIKSEKFTEGYEISEKEKEKLTLKEAGYDFTEEDYVKSIQKGDIVNMMRFIYAGMPLTKLKKLEYSPLFYAIEAKQKNAFELLLDKGAKINFDNNNLENLMIQAINNNLTFAIPWLIKAGINTAYVDHNGWSALHYAVENKNVKAVFLLLNVAPALLNYKNNIGNTPLLFALEKGYRNNNKELIALAKILIKKEKFIDTANIAGNSALHYAVMLNDYDFTKEILDLGANPNIKNLKRWRPIDIALKNKNVDLANLLRYYGTKL